MTLSHTRIFELLLCSAVLVLSFSCSKDADLLSDYVISDRNDLESIAMLADDTYFISNARSSMLLDVLTNDSFGTDSQVTIVETSEPTNGTVVINEDNTLTYTPKTSTTDDEASSEPAPTPEETETPQESQVIEATQITDISSETPEEDSFEYTTEVVTEEGDTFREVATVNITTADMGELLAFPGAVGFGKNTTGGRGGRIIHVTNLNDSGPGSLRAAINSKGKRTIVFDVGGDLYLTSQQLNISAANGNVTIAGETAPSPGITIRGDNISSNSYGAIIDIAASNVIIRYISVRENSNEVCDCDAVRLRNDAGMSNIILDHVSLSHGSDENFSIQGVSLATVQNSMITNSNTSYTFLFGTNNYDFSFTGNYLSHTRERNILIGYGKANESSEWINNIVYGYEGGMFMTFGNNADVLGNIYKAFANNTPNYASIEWNPNKYNNPDGLITQGSFFLADNHQLNNHQYDLYNSRALEHKSTDRVINNSLIQNWAKTTEDIEYLVFGDKLPGNSLHQDSLDEQAISDYFNNTGNFGSLSAPNKDSSSRSPDYDTDNDGMADDWENAIFGDLTKVANGDEDGDGYTNIEAFFFSLTL